MTLREWLERPYPLIHRIRDKALLVLGFGLFTYLFLLLYQPFGAEQIEQGREIFLLGFGASVTLGLSIMYFLLPLLLPKAFDRNAWKVRKEIAFLTLGVLLVSALNYTYNVTVGQEIAAPQHDLLGFIGISLSIGIFPILGLVFLTELYLKRRNLAEAQRLTDQMDQEQTVPLPQNAALLVIKPETVKSPPLEIPATDFLYATSDNNYSTVYFLKDGKAERKLLRLALKNLELQLADSPDIVRCHRSYIVNRKKIKDFQGNARSLFLLLEGIDEAIPVSRKISREELLSK